MKKNSSPELDETSCPAVLRNKRVKTMGQLQGQRSSIGSKIFGTSSPSYLTRMLNGPSEEISKLDGAPKNHSEVKLAWQCSLEKTSGQ